MCSFYSFPPRFNPWPELCRVIERRTLCVLLPFNDVVTSNNEASALFKTIVFGPTFTPLVILSSSARITDFSDLDVTTSCNDEAFCRRDDLG